LARLLDDQKKLQAEFMENRRQKSLPLHELLKLYKVKCNVAGSVRLDGDAPDIDPSGEFGLKQHYVSSQFSGSNLTFYSKRLLL